jgi:hypothetical protein
MWWDVRQRTIYPTLENFIWHIFAHNIAFTMDLNTCSHIGASGFIFHAGWADDPESARTIVVSCRYALVYVHNTHLALVHTFSLYLPDAKQCKQCNNGRKTCNYPTLEDFISHTFTYYNAFTMDLNTCSHIGASGFIFDAGWVEDPESARTIVVSCR